MLSLPSTLLHKLQSWINKYKPQLVIVFGSSIDGLPGPETDLDLALFFGKDVDELKAYSDLVTALKRDDLDLMYLDHAEPIAQMTAAQGELVYEDQPGRMEQFISVAHRKFMDHEKFHQLRRELNKEFLEERGLG